MNKFSEKSLNFYLDGEYYYKISLTGILLDLMAAHSIKN